ncbi:exportin-4-like [Styela clava]
MSSVTPEIVKHLEVAAQAALGIQSTISPAQRQEAEDVLLSFRHSKPSFIDCKTLLESTTYDTVQYQAAAALKDVVLREWGHTDENNRNSQQQFVLSFVMGHTGLSRFVREILSHLLAIMVKLSAMKDANPKLRESIYTFLTNLIGSGDQTQQLIACSIITALVTEFSITNKSSDMGMTWQQHLKCKKSFEDFDLKTIFSLLLEVLQHINGAENISSNETINLCHKFLIISEQILSWTFTAPVKTRRSALVQPECDKVLLKPHADWKKVLLNPATIKLFFSLSKKCQLNAELSRIASSCLAQLASLHGPVLENEETKYFYIKLYMQEFLQTYGNGTFHDCEALGIANACKNILDAHKLEIWVKTPEILQIFHQFLECLTKLTGTAMAGAAKEEEIDEEDHLYMEAFETMLDAWTTIIESISGPKDFIIPCTSKIFENYVRCHIVPPDGTRAIIDDSDHDYDEMEEDDRDRFCGQLMSIACIARTSPLTSMLACSMLLEKRVSLLQENLLLIKNQTKVDDTLLQNLFDDLHWIVLISGHVLADDYDGETSLIPNEIIQCSIAQRNQINQVLSLRILGSPLESCAIVDSSPGLVDPVIRLVSAILRLCEVVSNATRSNMVDNLSPQLLQDLMWFLKTWSGSYLLFREDYYDEISPVLSAAFGPDSEGGRWTVNYVTKFACTVLNHWTSEPKLLEDTADLLTTLVGNDKSCSIVSSSEAFWKSAHGICSGDASYRTHPSFVKQQIMSSIVGVGTSNMNQYRDKYWEQTMNIVKKRYHDLTTNHIFGKNSLNTQVIDELSSILDLLRGVADAASPQNTKLIFMFLSDFLCEGSKLMHSCKGHQTVIVSLLELFVQVAHEQVCYLPESKCHMLYDWTLQLLRTFSQLTTDFKSRDAEEESFQDLSLVIELLTHILGRDFIDFSDPDLESNTGLTLDEAQPEVSVPDVVFFGLGIILPHMNTQLLSYPSLCCQYYKLITFLCEIYPEKVELLPQEVLNTFLFSLQLGLSSYGNDNCKLCLEALLGLVDCAREKSNPNGAFQTVLTPFIKMVFDVILVHAGDMELLRSAGETFHSMFCFDHQKIVELFTAFVEAQPDPANKQCLFMEFSKLTPPPNTEFKIDRKDKMKFINLLEEVIFNVRGILCVK